MTHRRVLDVHMDGQAGPAGQLIGWNDESASFEYDEGYLARAEAMPLSLSMPLTGDRFGDVATRAFFANLLPENDQMQRLMDQRGIARSDFVGLLEYLGADCPGALSCVPLGAGPAKAPGVLATDYDPLDDAAVEDLVRRMALSQPLPDEVRDPSPVAGVQRKIALTRLPDGGFALPKSGTGAPTTHILKTPRETEARDAELEVIAARLAQAVGLEVAVPELVRIGDHPSVLIERYDRMTANGVVQRLHQEDFAQALGLPASLKYERYGEPPRVFDLTAIAWVLNQTAAPAVARREFIRLTLFNAYIGNADNHAKNHSLLYRGRTPVLAPAYDLTPTRLNASLTPAMGFRLGRAETAEAIDPDAAAALFLTMGFNPGAAERFVRASLAPMFLTLDEATKAAPKDFDDMVGEYLEIVSRACGSTLPLRERDHFQAVGGGWQAGS